MSFRPVKTTELMNWRRLDLIRLIVRLAKDLTPEEVREIVEEVRQAIPLRHRA